MVHAFQQNTPTDAKGLANDSLPQLKQLIELLSIAPKTVQSGQPMKIPAYSLDQLKEDLTPVTIESGAQIGCVWNCIHLRLLRPILQTSYHPLRLPRRWLLNGQVCSTMKRKR